MMVKKYWTVFSIAKPKSQPHIAKKNHLKPQQTSHNTQPKENKAKDKNFTLLIQPFPLWFNFHFLYHRPISQNNATPPLLLCFNPHSVSLHNPISIHQMQNFLRPNSNQLPIWNRRRLRQPILPPHSRLHRLRQARIKNPFREIPN